MKLLIAAFIFRLLNSCLLHTFYVPDEQWQSVEVAHRLVFGYGHLTWEWDRRIRGYLHPLLFASSFSVLKFLGWDSRWMVIVAPKVVQAFLAAAGDAFFPRFARRFVGIEAGRWATFAYFTNHFLLFSLPRTLTNSLETSLSIIALAFYPAWKRRSRKKDALPVEEIYDDVKDSRRFLTVAAVATMIRPTAAVTFLPLWLWRLRATTHPLLWVRDTSVIAGVAVIASVVVDSFFYGALVWAPLEFIRFNVLHDVASFYGSHPWHWYWTQGMPALLGPHLFPFLLGLKSCLLTRRCLNPLFLILWILGVYSLLGHKEFRFVFTALPLAMCYVGVFFEEFDRRGGGSWSWKKKAIVASTTLSNLLLFLYLSLFHQRGNVDAVHHVALDVRDRFQGSLKDVGILFLLPCHQHPFYSHIHLDVSARFLHCEPNLTADPSHVDEADDFFSEPVPWLHRYLLDPAEKVPTHVVLPQGLHDLDVVLRDIGLQPCADLFHAHFEADRRVGRRISVYCEKPRQKR